MSFYPYLKEALKCIEVIGETVNLKRHGNSYIGLCPFHNDRHPSLSISEKKNIWKCFVCNNGGDAVKFIALSNNIERFEALKLACEKYGLVNNEELNKYINSNKNENYKVNEVMKKTMNFAIDYANKLLLKEIKDKQYSESDVDKALDYLKSRGITKELINKYQIGFIPWNGIFQNWNNYDYQNDELKFYESGLIDEKNKDVFKNRIIFPLKNFNDEAVGIIGRDITNQSEAKYLISKNSAIFNKSECYFGNFENSTEPTYITEGTFDAISVAKYLNKENSISFLGTQISEEQTKFLKYEKQVNNVVIIPDNDNAGYKAIDDLSKILFKNKMSVFIAKTNFKKYKDINEIVSKEIDNIKDFEKDFNKKTDSYNSWKIKEYKDYLINKNEGEALYLIQKLRIAKWIIQRINDWSFDPLTINEDLKLLEEVSEIPQNHLEKEIKALNNKTVFERWKAYNDDLIFENETLKAQLAEKQLHEKKENLKKTYYQKAVAMKF